jgi:hypothetical protein
VSLLPCGVGPVRAIRGLLVPVPRLAAQHLWVVVRSCTTAVSLPGVGPVTASPAAGAVL